MCSNFALAATTGDIFITFATHQEGDETFRTKPMRAWMSSDEAIAVGIVLATGAGSRTVN
jgi:hypothetical protein